MNVALEQIKTEAFSSGRQEGRSEGRLEGRLHAFFDLVRRGLLAARDAAESADLSEADFIAKMAEYEAERGDR